MKHAAADNSTVFAATAGPRKENCNTLQSFHLFSTSFLFFCQHVASIKMQPLPVDWMAPHTAAMARIVRTLLPYSANCGGILEGDHKAPQTRRLEKAITKSTRSAPSNEDGNVANRAIKKRETKDWLTGNPYGYSVVV